MRAPKHHEPVREDQPTSPTEVSPPDAWAKALQRASAPMTGLIPAPQPWVQAAEAVVDWYGAMFRLALGLGRVDGGRERVTAPPAPPIEQAEAFSAEPLQSPPAAVVKLRPKRRKSPSMANRRSRSSKKTSGHRRSRRAA